MIHARKGKEKKKGQPTNTKSHPRKKTKEKKKNNQIRKYKNRPPKPDANSNNRRCLQLAQSNH